MKLVMGLLAALATTNVAAQQAIYAFTTEIERITLFDDTNDTMLSTIADFINICVFIGIPNFFAATCIELPCVYMFTVRM